MDSFYIGDLKVNMNSKSEDLGSQAVGHQKRTYKLLISRIDKNNMTK